MIVVDASVVAVAVGDDGRDGSSARDRLRGEALTAPELVDLETISVLRGLVRGGKLQPARAVEAVRDLVELRLDRVEHGPLLMRCWELRDNLTPYDAAYVALAELVDATLVTADARLSRAPGLRCPVELLTSS